MKKETKIIAAIMSACLIFILILASIVIALKRPTRQFVKYLEKNGYSYSKDICSMQSKIEEGSIAETYTEAYDFDKNTFTAKFIHSDRSKGITSEMEYVYNYKDDTITVNQYDTADAGIEGKPDAVYFLNREGMVECLYGEGDADEVVLYDNMLHFKQLFEKHLEESGVSLQDIIR